MSAALEFKPRAGRLPDCSACLGVALCRAGCLVAARCGSTTANGAVGLPRAKSTAAALVLKLGSLSVLGHRESRRAPAAINHASDSG
jgi:hypothetical protein